MWLLDAASTPAPPLDALHSVMASDAVRVLGGFAADCPGGAASPSRGASSTSATRARRRRRPERRAASRPSSRSTLQRLDKTEQCSDWQRRPLSAAQIAYAAADAACLHRLDAALDATAARDEREYCAAAAEAPSAGPPPPASRRRRSSADAADAEETLRRVREAAARTPGATVVEVGAVPAGAIEVNALCVLLEGAAALVLAPAAERVNLRWLALVLRGRARRGEAPARREARAGGRLRLHVRRRTRARAAVCSLGRARPSAAVALDAPLAYASAGHPGWRLLLADPARALPLLAAAANGADAEAAIAAAPADAAPIARRRRRRRCGRRAVVCGRLRVAAGCARLRRRSTTRSTRSARRRRCGCSSTRSSPCSRASCGCAASTPPSPARSCARRATCDGDGAADDGDGAPLNHKWKKKLTSLRASRRLGVASRATSGRRRSTAGSSSRRAFATTACPRRTTRCSPTTPTRSS